MHVGLPIRFSYPVSCFRTISHSVQTVTLTTHRNTPSRNRFMSATGCAAFVRKAFLFGSYLSEDYL